MPAVARIMVQATRSADHERLLPTMSGHKSPTPARDCTGRAPWAGTVLTLLALQLGFGLWLMPAAYSRCARATTARLQMLRNRHAEGVRARLLGTTTNIKQPPSGDRLNCAGWGGCRARLPSRCSWGSPCILAS